MTADYLHTSIIGLRKYNVNAINPFTLYLKSFDSYYKIRGKGLFRPIEGLEYTKKAPIVIFGCSFAYGHMLPDNEILSARLAEKAKRKVYNFAYPAWGVQEIIYLFKHNDTLRNIEKKAASEENNTIQYIIYWYISDHLRRIYHEFDFCSVYYYLNYEEKNGDLVPKNHKYPFIDAYYVVKNYKYYKSYEDFRYIPEETKYKFFNLHLKKIMEEKSKYFPNAQFILMSSSEPFPDKEVEILKNMNIRVLYTKDLTGIDMESDPEWTLDDHPNAAAVELLSDALIKELDL